jgi:hypothetical protein
MWATSDGPRVEDFGITEDDLARAPRFFFASHRIGLLCGIYFMAALAIFALMLQTGDSWSAAAFFTVITLAAGSVLLLPVVIMVVCAGERVEEQWLCRRVPILRACLAYRTAVEEHRRRTTKPQARPSTPEDWSAVSHMIFVESLRADLGRFVHATVFEVDRESTGFDFFVDKEGRRLLFRCESGTTPVAPAVGRELAASLRDHEADEAVIVTAVEPTQHLQTYIADRPITVVSPWEIEAELGMRQ